MAYQLYDYFRSSASFRVRTALYFKNIPFQQHAVHLVKDGGQHLTDEFKAINPQTMIPVLVDDDHQLILNQSLSILEYLEEAHPEPALLPVEAADRAKVRAIANIVACDIHPLNNLRVLKYLKNNLKVSEEQKLQWYQLWVKEGFEAIENLLKKQKSNGLVCFGDMPTLADVCLVPQVYNAIRFETNLDDYPLIQNIYEHCMSLEPFQKAAPDNQADAE